ncbi:MAG: tetratricopeptide repeat protein [Methylophilaceae bacterium]|nr:tetratricopeptide repeat protein [Methylophilaceae bacterium]
MQTTTDELMHPDRSDPAFISELRTQLKLTESLHTPWLADALAHRIARSPNDLRGHVQRIMLHQHLNQGDALFAALLDLFIALGHWGLALRKRLLQTSANLLNNTQYEFLNSRLDSGISNNEIHPPALRSRLSQGSTGSFNFIIRSNNRHQSDLRPALEQALDFLNYGQLDQAQETLEQALIENPTDPAIARELADLYTHTCDSNAVANLLAKLGMNAPEIIKNITLKPIVTA